MTRFLPRSRLLLVALLGACCVLQACAAADSSRPAKKIGMHIDAVLEFVVEYPLAWRKERRLAYGSRSGEVRWTHPEHPGTLLKISSAQQKEPATEPQRQIDRAMQEFGKVEIAVQEQVMLPAGEAWHVLGHNQLVELELYLVVHAGRTFLISLTTPPGTRDRFKDVMHRVSNSFQFLA